MPPPDRLAALYPPTCLLCGAAGARGRDLCPGCAADLPVNRHCCARCGLPFDAPVASGTLCGACRRRPPPYARCVAALRYQDPVPTLIGAAKFRGRLAPLRLLGQLLADAVRADAAPEIGGARQAPIPVRGGGRPADPPPAAPGVQASFPGLAPAPPEVLIPVPLHPRRLAERGYNQALELARTLGRELAIPVSPDAVLRTVATPPQAGLDEPARRRNVRGAFAVPGPLAWRCVAIVDDVVTTGSTAAELARVLIRAGVRQVEVWAVARTP